MNTTSSQLDLNLHETDMPPLRTVMKRLLILAAPIVGTMVSRMAMGFIDFVMVTRLGTESTAAISPATIFVFSVICLGMGAATSVQTFASQALGRREPREAAAYAWQGFYIAGAFFLLTLPISLCMKPMWALVGHPESVQALEVTYCTTALWCMAPSILCASLEGFFNGIQKPMVAFISVLVAITFNIIANYALIFGHWGFPALGIQGAAIATVIAWSVRALMLLLVFLSKDMCVAFNTRAAWQFSKSRLRGIIKVGGPTSITWVLDIGAWFVFLTLLMSEFGTAAMAATNIALQYMHFSFMPALGIGIALNSLVGHSIGEGNKELAVIQARACMIVTGSYMTLVGLVFWFARYPLMGMLSMDPAFQASDPIVVNIGGGLLIWAAIFQIFDAASITYMNALRGAGDTRWPAIMIALNCWFVFIGGGYLVSRLCPEWGPHGPWMTCTLYIILYGLALRWRWQNGPWRQIKLFKDKVPVTGFPVEVIAEQ